MSRRADSAHCPTCGCRFGSTNCVTFTSRGPNDPQYAEFILDDAATQLAECSVNGFGVFAPTWLIDPPSVSVYHSIAQEVPYDVLWPLLFNKELWDTDSMHDEDLEQSSRLTFNTAGIYLVTLNVTYAKKTVTSGDAATFLRRNSSELIEFVSGRYPDPDARFAHSLVYEGLFEAGEYVEALVKQDAVDENGDPITGSIEAERYSPAFAATFLRPAP